MFEMSQNVAKYRKISQMTYNVSKCLQMYQIVDILGHLQRFGGQYRKPGTFLDI